jgi:hypothetical protein
MGLSNLSDSENLNIMPGNLRKVNHFFSTLKRLLIFLKNFMGKKEILFISPEKFCKDLMKVAYISEPML